MRPATLGGTSNKSESGLQRELQYTRVTLDRADGVRRSDKEINDLWQKTDCQLVLLHENKNLFDNAFNPLFITKAELSAHNIEPANKTFLGFNNGVAFFSAYCSDVDAANLTSVYSDSTFQDLRSAGATLNPDTASILAYARGLGYWQSVSRYCGRCGGNNKLVSAGHAMQCQQCQAQVFPRTDPAVIMLVEHKDEQGTSRCLLGRSPAWPDGCYSTLAGFVETGESLEAAVIREVFEESGIAVENPLYVASQPWPFPQSIMLGYIATAVSSTIVLDEHELANAGWFSVDELSQFGEWADEGDGLKLPRKDSIARFLIDDWIAKQNGISRAC